jgi:predicted component of type VI protein secretion system
VSEFTLIEQKPSQGAEHPVEPGSTIGREGCDITVSDPDVSRRHAAVQMSNGGLSIEDLGSTNGTYVNGERISAPRALRDGDEVQIGSTVWRLRAPVEATRLREVPSGATRMSQATTLRPSAAEPPAPEPPAVEPPAPAPPAATPAPSAAARAPSAAGRRGDVPQPDFAPSAIRRIVPADAPTAFTPESQAARKGSAATRGGATLFATVVVGLTTAGVILYYITEPFA